VAALGLGIGALRILGSWEAAAPEAVDEPASTAVHRSVAPPDSRSRAGRPGEERTSATPAAPARSPSSTGSTRHLTVHVVDAATGAPFADLPLVAFREQGGNRRLGEAVTDERGRATFDELDRDLVLVETRRRPPHAATLGAAWIPDGERRTLELRVGRGGRLSGRVVDDVGQPIDGATLHLSNGAHGERFVGGPERPIHRTVVTDEVVARTDADGRYAIEAVASRPVGVWLVDGEPRPEAWEAVQVQARHRGARSPAQRQQVEPGADVELEDLIVDRARRYHGTIVDHDGRPVAGAVVTAGRDEMEVRFKGRDTYVDDPSHVATTDESGRFDVLLGRSSWSARVQVRDGRREYFELPPLEPGETSEPLRWRLRPTTRIRLVVTSGGERVPIDDPEWPFRKAIELELSSGECLEAFADEHDDGALVAWPCRPDEAIAFELSVPGHETVRHAFARPPRLDELVAIQLEPLPTIRLELVTEDLFEHEPWKSDPSHRSIGQIVACLGDAPRRADRGGCCGLGAWKRFELGSTTNRVDLHVNTREPYWIHAEGRGLDLQSFGPFVPGPDVHPIGLALDFAAFAPEPDDDEGQEEPDEEPPPPSIPTDASEDELGRVTAEIVDAATGEGVVARGEIEAERADGRSVRYASRGPELELAAPPGLWTVELSRTGYESRSIPVSCRAGETTHLGLVRLVPKPVWRARLVLGDDWLGELTVRGSSDVRDGWSFTARLDDPSATFLVGDDLPSELTFRVGSWSSRRMQWIAVDRWDPDDVAELELAPWRDVRIDVGGLAAGHERVQVSVALGPASGPSTDVAASPRLLGGGRPGSLTLERVDRDRARYGAAVAAGRYVVRATSVLYDFEPLAIDVRDVDGPQVFSLRAR